ncbi:GNAT family N-acetyltransferase [Arenimonas fontis]|uniref:GNAT family N-acetyltransferase n=1 Tax=Arenimonas fontis TaxID=2608255 RepID=A0A5B2Z8D0_9GAMM|nr:GNAT family N-acetyltransferase [Arenimonas fontis]KAA2284446.1 GNAT family N-acetyltransferase [Arenimonas fontis]
MQGPVIETARLLLRPTALEDFESWAALQADEEATRYIGGSQPRAAAWRSFLTMAGAWSLQGFGMFSVIERESGRWIGRVGPWYPAEWPGTEIGWSLSRESWGRGYATEAAAATMDFAVDVLGWTDIIHSIDPRNAGSQAVARRLGSVLRGPQKLPAPYENEPSEVWGQTAAQWRTRRGTA